MHNYTVERQMAKEPAKLIFFALTLPPHQPKLILGDKGLHSNENELKTVRSQQ